MKNYFIASRTFEGGGFNAEPANEPWPVVPSSSSSSSRSSSSSSGPFSSAGPARSPFASLGPGRRRKKAYIPLQDTTAGFASLRLWRSFILLLSSSRCESSVRQQDSESSRISPKAMGYFPNPAANKFDIPQLPAPLMGKDAELSAKPHPHVLRANA